MKLLLIRHAESFNNALMAAGRAAERVPDPPISELGWKQARALADWFTSPAAAGVPRPTRIFTSLMIRTIETATPLADALDVTIEPRLDTYERRGVFSGTMENPVPHPGTARSVLQAVSPRVQLPAEASEDGWYRSGFENQVEGIRRALGLVDWLRTMPEDDVVALVAHGDIGSMLLAALLNPTQTREALNRDPGEAQRHMGVWTELENTSVSLLDVPVNGSVRVHYVNRTSHLEVAGLAGQGASAADTGQFFAANN